MADLKNLFKAERNDAFEDAERKIVQAQRSGARKLDLKSLQLTTLPALSGQFTELQSLDLSQNQLTMLPEWIGQLTGLQSLDLSQNQLTILPEWMGQLTGLQWLNLSQNQLTILPEWIGQLTGLQWLNLSQNQLTMLPEWIGQLTGLQWLNLSQNQLTILPEQIGQLTELGTLSFFKNELVMLPASLGHLASLKHLDVGFNELTELDDCIGNLRQLETLNLFSNNLFRIPDSLGNLLSLSAIYLAPKQKSGEYRFRELPPPLRRLKQLETIQFFDHSLESIPEWLTELTELRILDLTGNELADLPPFLTQLTRLNDLDLKENPLNPELAAAHAEGTDAVIRYLHAKAEAQVALYESKLILIGEGEVGKSCLLGALRDDPWEEDRPTTHGIEIKSVKVTDPDTGTEITLNGWDFGGQRVYRPTHQLFFSAPAVYLAVWKPREGPQQGFIKEWIRLVRHREPTAKILVVATHGGPKERQPDIDRQEIWDLFGQDMVLNFFLVESKPDPKTQVRKGIADLKHAIAHVAASLPEMGRTVPRRWEETRQALKNTGAAYLPFSKVLKFCREREMSDDEARDFIRVSHRLGHLIYYDHDPTLRDIVVLKPDWLATAISFVLDDKQTRDAHGLVSFNRLCQLWGDPERDDQHRYPPELHPIFLRLMERFDLSYRIAEPPTGRSNGTSLVAQLVPDVRPPECRLNVVWPLDYALGDEEQSQICRIVETKTGQSATAEGLFFQLIVRLHRYSRGRANYADSVHWQRGLVLQDDYGAGALLEHAGNDIRITVRSPYPERFLSALTYEVKWLVESFWDGLRCDVMVPCLNQKPCIGLFEVQKLIENKKRNRPEQPCPICNEWQSIEALLHNAPAARPNPLEELLANSARVVGMLTTMRLQLAVQHGEVLGHFETLDASSKELVGKVEDAYAGLMRAMLDEAKEGPRLFSFEPVDPDFFGRPKWISERFCITLWCEHSRLPLPVLNGKDDERGVYDLTLPREWVTKAAPFLKVLAGTLSLVVPVAASATKFALDETTFKGIEKQLDLGQKSLDSVLKGGEKVGNWLGKSDAPDLQRGDAIRTQGAELRQLHAWLKEKDPSFGGLVRVQNRRQEFLWVHPQFEGDY